jgi:peptidoglycan/xylan/chitin deacetylase (PgdA/CDA1 family)
LTYHSLDESGSVISTSPAQFRWQMEQLHARGWRSLALDQVFIGQTQGSWPSRSFVLTFDDGFENFATHAMPVIAQYGLSAIVFAVSNCVGQTNTWPGQIRGVPCLPLLDWDGLVAIADAGIEIGGHSASHRQLTQVANEEWPREIVLSRRRIEARLGRPVRAFAYPYGSMSADLATLVSRHYRAGFTTCLNFATPASSPAAVERIDTFYLRQPWTWRARATGRLGPYLDIRRWLRALRQKALRRSGRDRPI